MASARGGAGLRGTDGSGAAQHGGGGGYASGGEAVPAEETKAYRRSHTRSVSHGGTAGVATDVNFSYDPNSGVPQGFVRQEGAAQQSILTNPGVGGPTHHHTHQRTFSHGQTVHGVTGNRGHKRGGSKTDFILPDGHEQREKERERTKPQLGRTSSFPLGHKRSTSRTESIYTIRETKIPLIQRIMFWRTPPPEQATRTVVANHVLPPHVTSPNSAYPTNKIRTTKYTLITFLPKNIVEQFHRFANIYFLFIVLLNFVPSINAYAKEVAMFPLLFVLGVTAVKDLFEDRRRHNSDKRVNNATCRVYCSDAKRYLRKYWKELRVGDVVHLSCNEAVPADLLLLNSSDPYGVCYIDSCNLDGESNLKQRQSVRGIGMDDRFDVSKLDCLVEISPPSTKIYHFLGSVPLQSGARIPLNENNLLLRSCFVKNTDYVEGLVVYAGHETKVMLNSSGTRYKRSLLERQMNTAVIWCVVILLLMCSMSATGAGLWQAYYEKLSLSGIIPFLPPIAVPSVVPSIPIPLPAVPGAAPLYNTPGWVAFLSFWTFVIIYQLIIPIALYVTIEVIKILQVYHIHHDPHFVDPKTGTTIECRAMNITEELGQVQYVFTDKTGTLTENNMVFQRCSINGVDYDHQPLPAKQSKAKEDKRVADRDSFLINQQLYDDLTANGGDTASITSGSSQPSQQHPSSSLMYHQRSPLLHQNTPPPPPPSPKPPHQRLPLLQQDAPPATPPGRDSDDPTSEAAPTVTPSSQQAPVGSSSRHSSQHSYDCLHQQKLLDFFLTLSMCNTVIVAKSPHKDQMTASGVIIPSPEDEAPTVTPSRFIPSLRAFSPVMKILPLPDRPRLNFRSFHSFNPFSRPLSPIASSPSSSPEPVPKHFSSRHPLKPNSSPTPNQLSVYPISEDTGDASIVDLELCTAPSVSSVLPATELQSSPGDAESESSSVPNLWADASATATCDSLVSKHNNSSSVINNSSDYQCLTASQLNWHSTNDSDCDSTNINLTNLALNPLSDSSNGCQDSTLQSRSSNRSTSSGASVGDKSSSFSNIAVCDIKAFKEHSGIPVSCANAHSPSLGNLNSTINESSVRLQQDSRLKLTPPSTLSLPLHRLPARSPVSLSSRNQQPIYPSNIPIKVDFFPSDDHASRNRLVNGNSSTTDGGFLAAPDDKGSPSAPTPADLQPIYEAESPDELALVDAAHKYGVRLLRRSLHSILVDVPGKGPLEYELLHVFPFDSTRKKMSVIVRHPHTGQIILYCKGADSAILDNLDHPYDQLEQFRQFRTQQHLHMYSKRGLRTLCVAMRVIRDTDYTRWQREHSEAESSLTDREYKLQNTYKKMERSLRLLGATGIEDRLQPGVPATLEALRRAGIVVWLLTGDKQETAINVAHSAALFTPDMQIFKLNTRTREHAEQTIRMLLEQTAPRPVLDEESESTMTVGTDGTATTTATADPWVPTVGGSVEGGSRSCSRLGGSEDLDDEQANIRDRGLVVDGKTLTFILDLRTHLLLPFLALTQQCSSVLISRATPLQKALVVKLAKQSLDIMTLAVGDGANDVSMIQTADVGIGISGVEGRQAVMASDFAISRFSHLHRLLLLHGHWCYDRLATIILFYFYKSANLVLILLWYQFYCSFSANNFLEQMYLIQFGLAFTSIPPVVLGVYDKDAPSSVLLTQPELYSVGRLGKVYTNLYFWVNVLDAVYQSLVMFFFAVAAHEHTDTSQDELSLTITHSCLVSQLLHFAVEVQSWTWLHVLSLVLSLLVFHVFSTIYTMSCVSCFGLESYYWVWPHLLASPRHWLIVLLTAITAVLPRFVYRGLQSSLHPTAVQLSVLRHRRQGRCKQQAEEEEAARSYGNPIVITDAVADDSICDDGGDGDDGDASCVSVTPTGVRTQRGGLGGDLVTTTDGDSSLLSTATTQTLVDDTLSNDGHSNSGAVRESVV